MDSREHDLLVRLRALCRQRDQTVPGTPEYERLLEAIRTIRRVYEEVHESSRLVQSQWHIVEWSSGRCCGRPQLRSVRR